MRNRDRVRDAADAADVAYRTLRFLTLVLPFDLAVQRNPTVLNRDLDCGRKERVPIQDVRNRSSDVRIVTHVSLRQLYTKILNNRPHALDPADRIFGRP